MASQTPVECDPQELKKAEALWGNFGVATKWSVILIAFLLIVLAIVFV